MFTELKKLPKFEDNIPIDNKVPVKFEIYK